MSIRVIPSNIARQGAILRSVKYPRSPISPAKLSQRNIQKSSSRLNARKSKSASKRESYNSEVKVKGKSKSGKSRRQTKAERLEERLAERPVAPDRPPAPEPPPPRSVRSVLLPGADHPMPQQYVSVTSFDIAGNSRRQSLFVTAHSTALSSKNINSNSAANDIQKYNKATDSRITDITNDSSTLDRKKRRSTLKKPHCDDITEVTVHPHQPIRDSSSTLMYTRKSMVHVLANLSRKSLNVIPSTANSGNSTGRLSSAEASGRRSSKLTEPGTARKSSGRDSRLENRRESKQRRLKMRNSGSRRWVKIAKSVDAVAVLEKSIKPDPNKP